MSLSGLFAEIITKELEKHGYITQEQREFYYYTYDWIIEHTTYYISLILLGILMHLPLPAFVYCFISSSLRFSAGGMHAPSKILCSVISYAEFIIIMLLLSFNILPTNCILSVILIYTAGIIIIIILAPLDHPNKRLSIEQKSKLKVSCVKVCLISSILLAFFYFTGLTKCQQTITICTIISASDLMLGTLLNRRFQNAD